MKQNTEPIQLSDIASQIADEMNIQQAIDAIDPQEPSDCSGKSQILRHIYFISGSSDAHREIKHIHEILERKNRSCFCDINQLPMDDSFNELTCICLLDSLYQAQQIKDLNKRLQTTPQFKKLRMVLILLYPHISPSDDLPEKTICLPGFDRISRELAIFKLVQEEDSIESC